MLQPDAARESRICGSPVELPDARMHRRALLVLAGLAAALPLARLSAEEKKKKSGGESYVPLDTLTATTIKATGRRGVLTVECGLDIPDGKLRQLAEKSIPRL